MGGEAESGLFKGTVMLSLWWCNPSVFHWHMFILFFDHLNSWQAPTTYLITGQIAQDAEIFLIPFIISLEIPALFTFLCICGQEMCLQPWLKVYLTSHLIYFFWFFLKVQPYHLPDILWQILWIKQFTRPCQIQQQILQNTCNR